VLLPALLQLDQTLLEGWSRLEGMQASVREYLVLHGKYLASPSLEQLLRLRFVKTELQQKLIVSEKPNLDLELQLRELFPNLLSAALSLLN